VNKSQSLVLFDIDGTLMRGAGPHHKSALVEGVRRITGLTTTLDGFPTQGMLDGDLLVAMLRAAGHDESAIQSDLEAIAAECERCYLANCAQDLRPSVCVGVEQVLAELHKRGVALGLVTGNFSAIGWKKLELAGLRRYFSTGAFAEDGTTRASLAKISLERALKAGLLADRYRVSLIGDHTNDIGAAKANGFQSIGVATGLTSLEELRAAQPDIAVRDFRELEISRLL
jgi:phosphoglycolate phosphatase